MVHQWRTDALANPLEHDRSRWFRLALTEEEYAPLSGVPQELKEELYPEVALYGPNGLIVRRLLDDLAQRAELVTQLDAIQVGDYLTDFNQIKQLWNLTLSDLWVKGIHLEDNLQDLLGEFEPVGLTVGQDALLFCLVFVTAIDGFCDQGPLSNEVESIRLRYYAVFDEVLTTLDLISTDYF